MAHRYGHPVKVRRRADCTRAQVAERERAEMDLTAEIAQHRAAAQRLKVQKAALGAAEKEPPQEPPQAPPEPSWP